MAQHEARQWIDQRQWADISHGECSSRGGGNLDRKSRIRCWTDSQFNHSEQGSGASATGRSTGTNTDSDRDSSTNSNSYTTTCWMSPGIPKPYFGNII